MTHELLPPPGRARVDLRSIEPSTHLIALCQGPAELAQAAAVCVGAGLASGDRVLYLASDPSLPALRTALEASGAEVRLALDVRQLVLRDFSGVQGRAALRDMAAAEGEFRAAAGLARAEGFPGLRIAADMGDITQVLGSIERAVAWERMTTVLQHVEGISSVCHYDQLRLGGEYSGLLAAEHAGPAPRSAPEPMASFRATRHGLRISGELDVLNRGRFVRTVSARLAAVAQLVLDVTELNFMDAGTLGELHRIAAGLPPEGRITITGASPQLRCLASFLEGWPHPQLTIAPAVPNDRDRVVGTGVET